MPVRLKPFNTLTHCRQDEAGRQGYALSSMRGEQAGAVSRGTHAALLEIESILAALGEARGLALSSRLAVVNALTLGAGPQTARLHADYLAQRRGQAAEEARLWNALTIYWRSVEKAHASLAEELLDQGQNAACAQAVDRALGALSAQAKLARLRYWAVEAHIWRETGRLLALADAAHAVAAAMPSWARFFLREMASPQNLLPREIELVDLLAQRYAARFVVQPCAFPGAACCFDLVAGSAPSRRFDADRPAGDRRFFGAGESYRDAESDALAVEQAGNLAAFPEWSAFTPDEVMRMLRHVARHWSPDPPARTQDRSEILSRVLIVFDPDEIRRNVANGGASVAPPKPAKPAPATARLTESWVVCDESSGGFGAEVPIRERDWLCAGKLIGFKREGGDDWGVGVIRRIELDQYCNGRVGIQILSEKPCAARVRPLSATQFAEWDALRSPSGSEYGPGLLLSIPQGRDTGMLLLPHGAAGEAPFFEWARGASSALIAVTKQAVRTHEYDLLMIRLA